MGGRSRVEKPTWRDLRREVQDADGEFIRQGATSHEVWKLPNGRTVTLQSKHLNEQVSKKIRNSIRNAIEGKD